LSWINAPRRRAPAIFDAAPPRAISLGKARTKAGEEEVQMISKRALLMSAAVAAAAMAAGPALAQGFPTKPVTMIVPFAAGGPTDIIARIVGEHMSKTLGQQVIVENVAGAGGTTGITRAVSATADGHTIAMGHLGTLSAAPALFPDLRYKPLDGIQHIGLAGGTPILIVAKKDFPPKNLNEFVAHLKANPTKVNEAHAGVGSVSWTTCTLLKAQLGLADINSVPYRGTGPALNDLVGGQVDFMCDQIPSVIGQVNAGTIKAYAIASAGRSPALPNIPTTAEAGLPGFQIEAWNGIVGPAGIPKPALDRLVDALDKALDDAGVKKRLEDLGAIVPNKTDRTPDGFKALIKRDFDKLNPSLVAAKK
jgi:tripartite-type tricarboxylate transporter receptor subunit TctC